MLERAEKRPASPPPIKTAKPDDRIPPPPLLPDKILPIIPPEPFKTAEEPTFLEKPSFIPAKPIPHPPKISPSSIPNPSPSVATTIKSLEPGYSNYGGYLYSIPGYSAFQPVAYPGVMTPNQQTNEPPISEFVPYPHKPKETLKKTKTEEVKKAETVPTFDLSKPQTDFEDQFTTEIVPAVTTSEPSKGPNGESNMSITSLAQGSGATITIPSQQINDNTKKKPPERFSLKTSIPISKIDMKCVNNTSDALLHSALTKKSPTPFNHAFQTSKTDNSRLEIQSNVIIKNALREPEVPQVPENKPVSPPTSQASNNINALINAAEAINKNAAQFKKPEPNTDVSNEIKDPAPTITQESTPPPPKPLFNPINLETHKPNFRHKPSETAINEQKNQILFIQKPNTPNQKMLLTIQQPNPQVLIQRTNSDSKNLQAPSRLLNQTKKCKEEFVNENGTSSKVVALKRLHQENCDENDFENLITENQIYGNKIVVKEKSQGTLQEQDLKNKTKTADKTLQPETKNVVLQSNFVYLSNVQFPANLMMIKNNTKINQTNDQTNKGNKVVTNENNVLKEVSTMTNSSEIINKKSPNIINKEIHVLKSSNNVLQTLSNKKDLLFQTSNPKVIVNQQIVYQVPMIVDADNKVNQQFLSKDFPKFINNAKKEFPKHFETTKTNDKLFIACPYQVDSKLQPKIVITNIRPKLTKVEEVSSLDLYEKRKRLRRLKYLSNRENKDNTKTDVKKVPEKGDPSRNIITAENVKAEIYKEFANTRVRIEEESSDSDSAYGEDDLNEYNAIINKYSNPEEPNNDGKVEFLASLRLATSDVYKDKQLDKEESSIRRDSVASAYIAAGRIDQLSKNEALKENLNTKRKCKRPPIQEDCDKIDNGVSFQKKQNFFSHLRLFPVSLNHKEEYEKTWLSIMKDRKRRENGLRNDLPTKLKQPENPELDPNDQLKLLREIHHSVNENNNLIKKRLDTNGADDGDSIHVLTEKNFSELTRLSNMADRSVKLFSGQETKKRDLNPGFDSENIQNNKPESKQTCLINIPDISKIISLKSNQDNAVVTTTQATSMDEPEKSASGPSDVQTVTERVQDAGCQTEDVSFWAGIEEMRKSYRGYDRAQRKEIKDLQRRFTTLRVECAQITRVASRESDQARALLAERQNLAAEEKKVRSSIQKIFSTIELVKKST